MCFKDWSNYRNISNIRGYGFFCWLANYPFLTKIEIIAQNHAMKERLTVEFCDCSVFAPPKTTTKKKKKALITIQISDTNTYPVNSAIN